MRSARPAQAGNAVEGIPRLRKVVEKYPQSPYAARALYLEGSCHLASMDYGSALACFEWLTLAYPESEYAAKANGYVERLRAAEAARESGSKP